MLTITLFDERPPSWNWYYSGVHWRERQQRVDQVQMAVRVALPTNVIQGDGFPLTKPADIRIDAYFRTKPQDADNIAAKFYIDALKGWVIWDDDLRCVASVTTAAHKADVDMVIITISWDET